MLLGTLAASLLGNILTGWGMNKVEKGLGINRAGEGVVRPGYGRRSLNSSKNKKNGFFIPSHPLIDFEIQKYY